MIKGADVAGARVVAAPSGDRLLTLDPETGEVRGLSAPSDWGDLPRAIDLLLQGQTLSAIQQGASHSMDDCWWVIVPTVRACSAVWFVRAVR